MYVIRVIYNCPSTPHLYNIRRKIMKKFIAMLVAMLLCVTAVFGLAACGDEGGDDDTTPPVVVTAEDAIKEIETLYGRDAKETSETYDLMGIVTVNGKKFNVDWTVTEATNQVTIAKTEVFVKDAEGNDTTTVDYRYYTVTLPKLDKDATVDYTITATITEGETTKTATFERTAVHGHVYADADCDTPKTCECGATEGEALGCKDENNDFKCDKCGEVVEHEHVWADATCAAPKSCKCGATEGEKAECLGADENFDLKCDVCGADVEYEIPTLEGEGISDVPYIITEAGKNICAFPAGYEPIWYNFTATEIGYITVYSAYEKAFIQMGTSYWNAGSNSNDGDGQAVTFLVTEAGQTVLIGISDYDYEEAIIPFVVEFKAVEPKDASFLAGNWTGSEDAWGEIANYGAVINEDCTGTIYYDFGSGKYVFDISNILYLGEEIVFITAFDGNVTFAYNEETKALTTAQGWNWGELTLTPYDGEISFEDVVVPEYDTIIYPDENTLFFSADEIAAGTATRIMYIMWEGNYYFDSYGFYVSAITDAEGNVINANDEGCFALASESEYTVTITILPDMDVTADTQQYLYLYLQTPDDGGEEDPFYVGTWGGVEGSDFGDTTYVFTFDAFGFGYGSYTMGEYTTTFDVTSITVEGNVITVETITTGDFAGSPTTLVFTYNEVDGTLSTEMAIMGGALTLAPIVPPTPEYELTIGANYINMENVNFTYTATEMGTLKLDVGTAMMGMVEITYTVNGGEVQTLALGSFVELNLNADDVVIIYVVAEGSATLGATWTAAV